MSSLDVLVAEDWKGAAVDDLVHSQMAGLEQVVEARITLEGPKLILSPMAAQYLGMALYELRTNALKYGSLSTASGTVDVRWCVTPDEFSISWEESGGPLVEPPTRRGFGTQMIERFAGEALGGTSQLTFDQHGLRWVLRARRSDALL